MHRLGLRIQPSGKISYIQSSNTIPIGFSRSTILSRTKMTLQNWIPEACFCPECSALRTSDHIHLTHDFGPWSLDFNPTVNSNEGHHDDQVYSHVHWHDTNIWGLYTPYNGHALSGLASNGTAIFGETLGHYGDSDPNTDMLGVQENIFDRAFLVRPEDDVVLPVLAPGHIPDYSTQGIQSVSTGPLDTSIETEDITTPGFCATLPSTDLEEPGIIQPGFYSDSTAIKLRQSFDFTNEDFRLPFDVGTTTGSPSLATSGDILAYGELESFQVFGQSPTSHTYLDENVLAVTDIFDEQGYHGVEAEVLDHQVGKLKPKSCKRSSVNNS